MMMKDGRCHFAEDFFQYLHKPFGNISAITFKKPSELTNREILAPICGHGKATWIQIVSQNNKMILFYFHGSVKHFNACSAMNACSVVDLIILKAEPDC